MRKMNGVFAAEIPGLGGIAVSRVSKWPGEEGYSLGELNPEKKFLLVLVRVQRRMALHSQEVP
jgi:hypothetical protein